MFYKVLKSFDSRNRISFSCSNTNVCSLTQFSRFFPRFKISGNFTSVLGDRRSEVEGARLVVGLQGQMDDTSGCPGTLQMNVWGLSPV